LISEVKDLTPGVWSGRIASATASDLECKKQSEQSRCRQIQGPTRLHTTLHGYILLHLGCRTAYESSNNSSGSLQNWLAERDFARLGGGYAGAV
jgi:hypothetical protein